MSRPLLRSWRPLLPRYIEMQVYHAVLEQLASEQSARMVAMRNASDAAGDMIKDLTLRYNKARQETITKELLESGGRRRGPARLTEKTIAGEVPALWRGALRP